MKKFLLLTFSAFLINLSAQSSHYHPFPTDTSVWLQDVQTQTCAGYCYSNRFTQQGDTILNSIQYKKLYKQTGHYSMCGNSGGNPIFCFTPTSNLNYLGGLRQDSLNKKVYFFPPSLTHNTILYDFNLQVGDTLKPTYLQNQMGIDKVLK